MNKTNPSPELECIKNELEVYAKSIGIDDIGFQQFGNIYRLTRSNGMQTIEEGKRYLDLYKRCIPFINEFNELESKYGLKLLPDEPGSWISILDSKDNEWVTSVSLW